jgi:hypothetical protein
MKHREAPGREFFSITVALQKTCLAGATNANYKPHILGSVRKLGFPRSCRRQTADSPRSGERSYRVF